MLEKLTLLESIYHEQKSVFQKQLQGLSNTNVNQTQDDSSEHFQDIQS